MLQGKKSTLVVAMLIFLFTFSIINAQTKVALLGGAENIEENEPDVLLRDKLLAMDFQVEYILAELVEDRVVNQDSIETFDLIVISGTIKPTKVRKLVDYGFPVPTINMDVASIRSSHHYLSLVSSFFGSGWLNKQDENGNKIKIINGEHPLAAGYQTNQLIEAITNPDDYIATYPQAEGIIGYMRDNIGIIPIASLNTTNGDPAFVICGIERGTINLEDVTFKARYVQFNLYRYTINTWKPAIDSLFAAAIDWVLKEGTTVEQPNQNISPIVFTLSQNYPNPFNPETTIEFGLPKPGFVEISIYSITS
ncbi:hypothetical protein H8E88_18155 [candidate division KSB1 bacterium]|nr:hypothetical protein [candidate division KSB1 bacterium]